MPRRRPLWLLLFLASFLACWPSSPLSRGSPCLSVLFGTVLPMEFCPFVGVTLFGLFLVSEKGKVLSVFVFLFLLRVRSYLGVPKRFFRELHGESSLNSQFFLVGLFLVCSFSRTRDGSGFSAQTVLDRHARTMLRLRILRPQL